MSGGPVRVSTLHTMKQFLATAPQLAVLRVDLRNGQYWWSTRLFFLACVAEEIAATGLLIFLQDEKKFVGASTPATVRDRLARGDPLLREFEENCRRNPVDPRNIDHALDQRATQWDALFDKQAEEKEEKTRILVSTRELRRWLGSDLLQRGVEQGRVSLAPAFLKNILDWPHPYVPITSNGDLVMVINRTVFTEQLARMFVQDLERPSGTVIASSAVRKPDLSVTERDPP